MNCACAQPPADTHHVHSGLQSSQEDRHKSLTQDHRPPLAHTHIHGYNRGRSDPGDRLWREQVSGCFHLDSVRGSTRSSAGSWILGHLYRDTLTQYPHDSGESPFSGWDAWPQGCSQCLVCIWNRAGQRWGPSGITLTPQGSTPSLPLYLSSVMGGKNQGCAGGWLSSYRPASRALHPLPELQQ